MTSRTRIVRRELPAEVTLPEQWHALTRRVLAQRGVQSASDIDTSLSGMLHANELSGIERAVELLEQALRAQQRIMIIGDFDADGATSTALAVRALTAMGAADVRFLVPNRFEYGYGLTPEIVALAAAAEPHLIITVDNGISSIEGVAAANQAGIQVLVTDHHLPGQHMPAAAAIVNPNVPGDTFASKNLAGVGVIFYVLSALRTRLRDGGWFESRKCAVPKLTEYLDLVALGTVADVVKLDHNNRRLVAQGLKRIRAGHCCAGIKALIDVAGRQRGRLTTSDLGFAIGPRLNAAGRLADMSVGIACLLSDSEQQAAVLAEQLDQLNRERREIEGEMRDHAFALLNDVMGAMSGDANGLCVYHEQWHQGVIGIVAARVKDRFHRPTIAFARGDDDELKGSARSITGVHIRDALDNIATQHPGLIRRFGGHAMAAGLTLAASELEQFTAAFDNEIAARLDAAGRTRELLSDGGLEAADYSLALARELAEVAPWGQGFPEPRFDGEFLIEDRRVVGSDHAKLVLRAPQASECLGAIAFGAAGEHWFREAKRIRALFKLDVNEYRGVESLQLVVDYAEAVPS